MDWAGINILTIILVVGSQSLVSGNTCVEENKDIGSNLQDYPHEADIEDTPIRGILDKDVPNENENEDDSLDYDESDEILYGEDGNILVEDEHHGYANKNDHPDIKDGKAVVNSLEYGEDYTDGDLKYDEEGNITEEDEYSSDEGEDDHSEDIMDDETVVDMFDGEDNAVGDLKYYEEGNITEEDEYASYEDKDDQSDIKDNNADMDAVYEAVYADKDVIYDVDGNIKDDDEDYSYEQDDDFLDVSKETYVGEVVHDDNGNVLDDEADYSYETEDDFTEICPDNYIGIRSECFQMSHNSLDWDKAKATCEENSGQLASLKHPMALREYIITHYPKSSFWVGGRHLKNPDRWEWISGNKFSPSFPWATHNRVPKKNQGECIVLRYFPKQGEPEYVDNKCTRKIRFICERQKVKLDLDKKSATGEQTAQTAPLMEAVKSTEEIPDLEKKPDIDAITPLILEQPPSGEDTIDDLKSMLSG